MMLGRSVFRILATIDVCMVGAAAMCIGADNRNRREERAVMRSVLNILRPHPKRYIEDKNIEYVFLFVLFSMHVMQHNRNLIGVLRFSPAFHHMCVPSSKFEFSFRTHYTLYGSCRNMNVVVLCFTKLCNMFVL